MSNNRLFISFGISLGFSLGLTYWVYSQAFGGGALFDDAPNLKMLETVSDLKTALVFIFSGESGPLGRSVALATFALQFHSWPGAFGDFLHVNILIHLLNATLVTWFGYRLLKLRGGEESRAVRFALALSVIWMLQPLLVSASLMSIQRMTTLSATFMLLGLIGYLIGREQVTKGLRSGWSFMAVSLALATSLAVLTKETGALLPIFALVLEVTLLSGLPQTRGTKLWQIVLSIPLILLIGYAMLQIPHLTEQTARGYSSGQRFLAEGPILWRYVRLMFLPKAADLGPFHDDVLPPVNQADQIMALIAWLAWAAVLLWAIKYRSRMPWAAFAVGWFILGHSLESTVFCLEPYFEHRNYVPSLGPLGLLSALVASVPEVYATLRRAFMMVYPALLAFISFQVTAAWGDPDVAATLWASRHPTSERAQQFIGNRMLARGDIPAALAILEAGYRANTNNVALLLQQLQLECGRGSKLRASVEGALQPLQTSRLDFAVVETLSQLIDLVQKQKCPELSLKDLHDLISAVLDNQNYQEIPNSRFKLHHFEARLFYDERNLDSTMQHLEAAFEATPDLDTGVLMIGILESAGLHEEALAKLGSVAAGTPKNPIIRRQWEVRLNEIAEDLKARGSLPN